MREHLYAVKKICAYDTEIVYEIKHTQPSALQAT